MDEFVTKETEYLPVAVLFIVAFWVELVVPFALTDAAEKGAPPPAN